MNPSNPPPSPPSVWHWGSVDGSHLPCHSPSPSPSPSAFVTVSTASSRFVRVPCFL
jgi:hypothetical protein